MPQQNFTSINNSINIENTLLAFDADATNKKISAHKKSCKHRNENGWCNKSQRQCALLNIVFIKH